MYKLSIAPLLAVGVIVAASSLPTHAQTPLERGRYLEHALVDCGGCHTQRGPAGKDKEFAGGEVFDIGIGRAVSPNITPDKETGIGSWTDAQIITAIRSGVRPDGRPIGPPMPIAMYQRMSDDDARAIVAYLRTLKPINNTPEKSAYKFPMRSMPPVHGVKAPPRGDKVAYGGYLAGPLAHCMECHTPQQGPMRDYANRMGAGGFEFNIPGLGSFVAANVTPDKETGIGTWTDAQIKNAITKGVRPDGTKLIPLMPFESYAKMTASDLDSIVAYLRSLKPIHNKVR
jgi:mono/diheme cytochrome c family protein